MTVFQIYIPQNLKKKKKTIQESFQKHIKGYYV